MCKRGGGDRGPQVDEQLPPSTFTGQFKKSRCLGFGVFLDIWSVVQNKWMDDLPGDRRRQADRRGTSLRTVAAAASYGAGH